MPDKNDWSYYGSVGLIVLFAMLSNLYKNSAQSREFSSRKCGNEMNSDPSCLIIALGQIIVTQLGKTLDYIMIQYFFIFTGGKDGKAA